MLGEAYLLAGPNALAMEKAGQKGSD